MPLAMARPMIRSGSRNVQFVQRIPADVRDRVKGLKLHIPVGDVTFPVTVSENPVDVRVSLRTSDPSEAKQRHSIASAYLSSVWESVRNGPKPLTMKQVSALAGKAYKSIVSHYENEPGSTRLWANEAIHARAALTGEYGEASALDASPAEKIRRGLEERFGVVTDKVLAVHSLTVDPDTRDRLNEQIAYAVVNAADGLIEKSVGVYRPDVHAEIYPEWPGQGDTPPAKGREETSSPSLIGLVDRWWSEANAAGRSVSTHDSYRATVIRLSEFLGHDNAGAVTTGDILRFKDHRLTAGISLKTIKDSDLAGLKAIFGYAVANRLLTVNPVIGIKVVRPNRVQERERGFTAQEAIAILSQSYYYERGSRELEKTAAAKRWVPWLCAYTGARVGEIAQLRKQDVATEDGHWVIAITPEAGTVKGKRMRRVVLHPHLIDDGFADFVDGADGGHLFLDLQPGEDYRGKWRALKNRLGEFARLVVSDPRVQPNHGWRHLFTTICREVGIEDSIIQYMGGWTPTDVLGKTYGNKTVRAQANALQKFPRFKVADASPRSNVYPRMSDPS